MKVKKRKKEEEEKKKTKKEVRLQKQVRCEEEDGWTARRR